MARLLRERGLRATGPRLLILGMLRRRRTHPTPEEIHAGAREEHPALSLSTVYQTLETFLQAGLCRRMATPDGCLRVDGTVDDHDHAVCRSCGTIFDLEPRDRDRLPEPRGLPRGTRLMRVCVEYDVICPSCAACGAKP
jgi:Fe2+ or Zn2+ uptake regulation protein